MTKNSSEKIAFSNIFAEGFSMLGVIFSTLLSFIITVVCSISDYTQISALLDSVQHESVFTVVVTSVTICIFLDFSMYVAGTVVKRMSSGKPLGGSMIISAVSIVIAFLLFGTVFTLSFKFKYALKDYLFSLDSAGTVDAVINNAVKAGSEIINNIPNININEEEIIKISAILSGLLPAFTSLLSLLSVLLLYDPLASEKAAVKIQLIFYKYRYYQTQKQLTIVDSELFRYKQLPQLYSEVLKSDYENYTQFCKEAIALERMAKTAEYTAAIELFKKDQDTVTRLSSEASEIQNSGHATLHTKKINDSEMPQELLSQISAVKELFDLQRADMDMPSSQRSALTEDVENPQNNKPKAEPCGDGNPDSSVTDAKPFKNMNIPDSMVSPQLNQAVNQ